MSEGYTTIANVLDFSAVIVPVSHVDKNIDLPNPSFVPIDERDRVDQAFCEHFC